MSQFYLTLPSNTTTVRSSEAPRVNDDDVFGGDAVSYDVETPPVVLTVPQQTLSKFRVNLPQRIKLDGDWEVSLAEIMYPNSWFNFNKGDAVLKVTFKETRATGDEKKQDIKANTHVMCEIFPNQYNDPDELVKALVYGFNSALEEHIALGNISERISQDLKMSFVYERGIKRMLLKTTHPEYIERFIMTPHLSYVLGFEAEPVFLTSEGRYLTKIVAKYPVDLRAGFYAMYIYCSLVANQVIGDTLAPLLRTVTVEGKHEDVICKVYNTPHYVPLAQREFDSVELLINDDQNKPVKFQFGKIIVKLHFRRQKPDRY